MLDGLATKVTLSCHISSQDVQTLHCASTIFNIILSSIFFVRVYSCNYCILGILICIICVWRSAQRVKKNFFKCWLILKTFGQTQ